MTDTTADRLHDWLEADPYRKIEITRNPPNQRGWGVALTNNYFQASHRGTFIVLDGSLDAAVDIALDRWEHDQRVAGAEVQSHTYPDKHDDPMSTADAAVLESQAQEAMAAAEDAAPPPAVACSNCLRGVERVFDHRYQQWGHWLQPGDLRGDWLRCEA